MGPLPRLELESGLQDGSLMAACSPQDRSSLQTKMGAYGDIILLLLRGYAIAEIKINNHIYQEVLQIENI